MDQPTNQTVAHALRHADIRDDVDAGRRLLDSGTDIYRRSRNEHSILRDLIYQALCLDDDADARYVLRRCDINKLDDCGYNALHYAIRFGGQHSSAEMVRLLLEAGADPRRPTREGYSPLQLAVTVGDAPVIGLLRPYDDRETAPLPSRLGAELAQAARHGDLPRLRELLDAGADPNGDDWNLEPSEHPSNSPLFDLAASNADDAVSAEGVRLLLQAGANVFRENHENAGVLLEAAFARKPETMKALLEAGADPDACDERGWDARTAIFNSDIRSAGGTARCLSLLLDHGVSIMRGIGARQRQDDIYDVPACALLDERFESALKLLIARRYPLDEADADGYTLLHYCAGFGDEGRCAGLLLAAGADINARNKAGQTPMEMAQEAGNDEFWHFLRERGARTGIH